MIRIRAQAIAELYFIQVLIRGALILITQLHVYNNMSVDEGDFSLLKVRSVLSSKLNIQHSFGSIVGGKPAGSGWWSKKILSLFLSPVFAPRIFMIIWSRRSSGSQQGKRVGGWLRAAFELN